MATATWKEIKTVSSNENRAEFLVLLITSCLIEVFVIGGSRALLMPPLLLLLLLLLLFTICLSFFIKDDRLVWSGTEMEFLLEFEVATTVKILLE